MLCLTYLGPNLRLVWILIPINVLYFGGTGINILDVLSVVFLISIFRLVPFRCTI